MTTRRGIASRLAWLAACLVATTPLRAALAAPVVLGTCPGEDWRLAESVEPLPRTGLFTMDGKSREEAVAHRGHTLTWRQLNPKPGVYDWSSVERALTRAERDGHGVVLRLKSSVAARRSPFGPLSAVPDWVLERHSPPLARLRDRGRREWLDVVVPWDEGVQAAYLEFVRAFGAQGFHRHRRLLGLYVHGISTSWGEEMWLDEGAVASLRPHGLSPDRLRTTFEARIAAWADAFGDQVGRLAWVGTGWIAAGDAWRTYRAMGAELDAFSLDRGLGRRWGHNEAYNGQLQKNGQTLGQDGRLRTDPTHPLVAGARYWGGENEVWKGRRSEAFDYRRATLRALQMEMRLLWVNDRGVALDREIARYFTQSAGRDPSSSPDAWAVLRETEVRVGSKPRRVGNLERWLYMIGDAEGQLPPAVRPVARARQSKDWGAAEERTARVVAPDDGERMRFELDDRFVEAGSTHDVTVQVTWIDDGARWRVGAHGPDGLETTDVVHGDGDGTVKTTSVRVDRFAASGDDPDIELVADAGRLAVSRVRLVRSAAVAPGCSGDGRSGGTHG